MSFDPQVFGEGFHRFVQLEYSLFGSLSLFFHAAAYLLLISIFIFGNRARKAFDIYFAFNWLFLLGYWGVFGVVYWLNIGLSYLAVYVFAPVLLLLIFINWVKEIKNPQINLDLSGAPWYRYVVFAILIWGIWYPEYIYAQGFAFHIKDLLFSYFGLMPCPTTMFVLSILTIKYPETNRQLYKLLTLYAIFIGTATVMSGWLPDIPFIVLGIYAFILAPTSKKNSVTSNL